MKVSVVLCSYNGEDYIEEQLKSIVHQSIKPDEIIVCDDGSTDNTVSIASKILSEAGIDYRIEINEMNVGVTKNFERGIELATGDIIFLSDQDDIWNYEKIKTIKQEFEKDKSCIMVFTDAELVDKKRKKLGIKLWETLHFSKQMLDNCDFMDILLNRCIVTGATMAFRKELFDKIKPFPEYWLHDGWIAINAPLHGRVKAIEIPLIEYRQHGKNVIGASKSTLVGGIKKYFYNIRNIEIIREQRYNRYKVFYDFNAGILEKNIKDKVVNCLEFWHEMKELNSIGMIKGLETICTNYINGNYKKYYTGVRGAIRDILYLVYREGKQK